MYAGYVPLRRRRLAAVFSSILSLDFRFYTQITII